MNSMGERIKEIRKKLNITQKNFAGSLHMANSYLSEIENGKANPSFEFFYSLSYYYNVSLNYLFHGIGPMFLSEGSIQMSPRNQDDYPNDLTSIHDLTWLMENSPLFRDNIMGFAAKFFYDNDAIIKKNIKTHKANQEENIRKEYE